MGSERWRASTVRPIAENVRLSCWRSLETVSLVSVSVIDTTDTDNKPKNKILRKKWRHLSLGKKINGFYGHPEGFFLLSESQLPKGPKEMADLNIATLLIRQWDRRQLVAADFGFWRARYSTGTQRSAMKENWFSVSRSSLDHVSPGPKETSGHWFPVLAVLVNRGADGGVLSARRASLLTHTAARGRSFNPSAQSVSAFS